jgi:hypothetical protein
MTQKLANEYAEKIKALTREHERKLEALYREFQTRAADERASTEDLTSPGADSSSPQSTDEHQ